MIAMKFTTDLDIGFSFLPRAALSATASDGSRDENSSSCAVQAIVRPLPTPHCGAAQARGHPNRQSLTDGHRPVSASGPFGEPSYLKTGLRSS